MTDFNIPQLFHDVFGVTVNKAYNPQISDGKPNMPTLDYSSIELVDKDEAYNLSALGTPIIFPITFKGGLYNVYDSTGQIYKKQMGDFRLPISATASFRRPKIIGKARAAAGYGTNKETYSLDDWQIQIRGFCLKDPAQPQSKFTAMDQEQELIAWDEIVDSIAIEGTLFELRGIHSISIEDIPMDYIRGNRGLRPFIINAVSDTPAELIL